MILFSKELEKLPIISREFNNLREIYEARLKFQQDQVRQHNSRIAEEIRSWRRPEKAVGKLLQPRYERRQRKADDNQPDVVPKPPPAPPAPVNDFGDRNKAPNEMPASVIINVEPIVGKDLINDVTGEEKHINSNNQSVSSKSKIRRLFAQKRHILNRNNKKITSS